MDREEFIKLQAGDILITNRVHVTQATAMKGLISASGVPSIRTLGFGTVFPEQVQAVIKHDHPDNHWTNGTHDWPEWPVKHGIMPGDQLFKEDN